MDAPFYPAAWHEELSPSSRWSAQEVTSVEGQLTESSMFKAIRDSERFRDGAVRGWDPNNSPWMRIVEDPHVGFLPLFLGHAKADRSVLLM